MGKVLIIKGADFSNVAVDQLVSTPVISITSQGVVTITSDNAVAIYYTTNGSTPTVASSAYNGEFNVSLGTTVKAIAVGIGGTQTSVSEKTYTGTAWVNNDYTWGNGGISMWGTSSGTTNASMSIISPAPQASPDALSLKATNGYRIGAVMKNTVNKGSGANYSYETYSSSDPAVYEITIPAGYYFIISLVRINGENADLSDAPSALQIAVTVD